MTTALLNQLHDHKLAQIRARAQKQIELWREAIVVVKKAEQESKCIIALPEKLTNIAAVEKRVGSVGYMEVMDMDGEINRLREQVYGFAVEKLDRMRNHLQREADVRKITVTGEDIKKGAIETGRFTLSIFAAVAALILFFGLVSLVSWPPIIVLIFILGGFVAAGWTVMAVVTGSWKLSVSDKKVENDKSHNQMELDAKGKISQIEGAVAQIEAHRSANHS